jgi:hypothetical protein
MQSIRASFQKLADARNAKLSAMSGERKAVSNRLKSLAPSGERPARHQKSSADFTDPRTVGGSGYIPKRMAMVDNRPKRIVPTMTKGLR